jgi:hypothetical protein
MRTIALFTAITLVSCVEKEPGAVKVDEGYVKSNILSAEPTPKLALNADLDGKIIYLGADVDKQSVAPGETVKITHYWKVVQPPGPEWRVFTHVEGGGKQFINVDKTKLRDNHGPDKWKAGEILRDEQTITIKKDWSSPEALVVVGLYRKGKSDERMKIVTGPNNGKGGLTVAKLSVTGAATKPPERTAPYVLKKTSTPINVDGKPDDAAWAQAASTGPFKTATGSPEPEGETKARLLYDEKNLYVLVEVADKDITSQFTKDDEPIWKEDCVELFIDADRNGQGYVELQVSPRNVKFDSFFKTVRPNGDVAWSSGMKTAVTLDGTLDKRDDTDKGWIAEFSIPLEAVKGALPDMKVNLPPKMADMWRLNVVRVEKGKSDKIAAAAWGQITYQDFHGLDRLMNVVFADDKGAIPEALNPSPTNGVQQPGLPGAPASVPGAKTGSAPASAPASVPASAPTSMKPVPGPGLKDPGAPKPPR